VASACTKRPETPATIERPAPLASAVRTSDANHAAQLVAGFHEIEQNAWRWAAHEFSVNLRPPAGSAAKGAMLTMQFALPDAVFATTGPIAISAKINGVAVPAQKFLKAGPQSFSAAVPAAALAGERVRADFTVDKFLPSGTADKRELSVIVSTVALEPVQ
jgi:hypothetical protein